MDQEIRKYLDIITKALSCVKQQYYNLETTYDSAGIVRERVFVMSFIIKFVVFKLNDMKQS